MTRYIPLDVVVAEIERRRRDWCYGSSIEAKYKREECEDILSFLDTLEVKEVDLEKEINLYLIRNPVVNHKEESLNGYIKNVAKHFYELGLKAKGE